MHSVPYYGIKECTFFPGWPLPSPESPSFSCIASISEIFREDYKDSDAPATKGGNDYTARVYVVFPSVLFWKTRAVNYIWANRLPRGSFSPTPTRQDRRRGDHDGHRQYGGGGGRVVRAIRFLPPGSQHLSSPLDTVARYGMHRGIGVHGTRTVGGGAMTKLGGGEGWI